MKPRLEHQTFLTRRQFFGRCAMDLGTAVLALLCCVTNGVAAETKPIARESTCLWCAAATGAQTSLDPRQLKEWTPNSCYRIKKLKAP